MYLRNAERRLLTVASVVLTIVLAALAAYAGMDGDGVPDFFDNCELTPNGPAELSNQVDTDLDGWGNACDPDYTQDGIVTTVDYSGIVSLLLLGEGPLAGADLVYDHDGDGHFTLGDLEVFEQTFLGHRQVGQ